MNIFNYIILVILSLVTIRDLLVYFGIIPLNSKIGKFLYGRYEKDIIKSAITELGFKKEEFEVIKRKTQTSLREHYYLEEIKEPSIRLVELISKSMVCFGKEVKYGEIIPKQSRYYINTMEIAHNEEMLDTMSSLIYELIYRDYKNGLIDKFPDFILTPKSGNPLLGFNFSKKYQLFSIFKKAPKEKSSAKLNEYDYDLRLKTNYEGMWELFKESEKRKLFGVIIDCNTSGGSQLLDVMIDFNKLIDNANLNIKPINSAYVLFRGDESIDVDAKFTDNKYRLSRYFDLNEDMKNKLYLEISNRSNMNKYIPENKEKIQQFLIELSDKGLFKTKIDYL